MAEIAMFVLILLQVTALNAALKEAKERAAAEKEWRTFAREHQCVEGFAVPGVFKCVEPTPTYWIETKHD